MLSFYQYLFKTLNYKELIFEGFMQGRDLEKTKYIEQILSDIESGQPIKVRGSNGGVIFDDNTPEIQTLRLIRYDVKKVKEFLQDSNNRFKKVFKAGDKLYTFGDIEKIQYSGAKLNKLTSKEGTQTQLQEASTCIILDSLIENSGKVNKVEDVLQNYEPSDRLVINKKLIPAAIEFMTVNESWAMSAFKQANAIFNNFNKIYNAKNPRDYEIHYGSSMFNAIRSMGKRLSKLTEDKWCPADVWLVKKGAKIPSANISIFEYNKIMFNSGDFIGISLKKSDFEAMHGAAAISNAIAEYKLPTKIYASKYNKDNAAEAIIANVKEIQANSKKESYPFYVRGSTNSKAKTVEEMVQEIDFNSPHLSRDFFKSLPLILDFISDALKSPYTLFEIIEFLALLSFSRSAYSCNHYKASGDKFEIIQVGSFKSFSITACRIKLNGDMDVIFDIHIDDSPYKAQIRSKGSLPQMIQIMKIDNAERWTEIHKLK